MLDVKNNGVNTMMNEYVDKLLENYMNKNCYQESEVELFKAVILLKIANELEKLNNKDCN